MNQLQKNFRQVIDSWVAGYRLHKQNKHTRKLIRRHGKALKEARKQADELHKATGKAYFVMPDYTGELRVLDKASIKNLKRFKVMSDQVTVVDLLTESEYHTINTHFVVLFKEHGHSIGWYFFRGTILECIEKYKDCHVDEIQILGGFERIASIKNGKVIKH